MKNSNNPVVLKRTLEISPPTKNIYIYIFIFEMVSGSVQLRARNNNSHLNSKNLIQRIVNQV